MLEILHPAVANRACETCLNYQFNEETGTIEREANGAYRKRETPPRCQTKRGCPKGTPENPKTLWPTNRQAYDFYLECKATGHFPDDPFVAETARIISEAVADAEQRIEQREDPSGAFLQMLKYVIGHKRA